MRFKDRKILSKSSYKKDSQTVLIYHLLDTKKYIKFNGKKSGKLLKIAKGIKNYFALSILASNEKKYIHISSDEVVTLSDKPTCVFEQELFINPLYSNEEELIVNIYKKSHYFKQHSRFRLEIISNNEIKNIVNT